MTASEPALLKDILQSIQLRVQRQLRDPSTHPSDFVIELYTAWKDGGGTIAGKTRHSDRFLDDELRKCGMQVRSLNPKLAARRTNLQPIDGSNLVNYFLTHWPVSADSEDGADVRYEQLVSSEEILSLSAYVSEKIVDRYNERHVDVPDEESRDSYPPGLPGEDVATLVIDNFEHCDALITISPEHVLISAYPKSELIGFKGLMDRLWAVERRDEKPRPLVWVLDVGDWNMEDLSTRKKYLNVQSLISRFKALARFPDINREKRLSWIASRAVIIVLDMDIEQNGPIRRPNFSSHHVSFTTTPNEWFAEPNFRALYGSALEHLDQRNFSVFFRAEGWNYPNSAMKYMGYALFKSSNQESFVGRGLELPVLPRRYEVALQTVCASAFDKLDLHKSEELLGLDGRESADKLKYLGFTILNFNEFLERY